MAAKVRKNDTVLVLSGRERGKRGRVERVIPDADRVIIEGINIVKRHSRPRGMAQSGGIIEKAAPLRLSKVMLVCNKCDKPVRPGFKYLEDGSKVRYCRHCNEVID